MTLEDWLAKQYRKIRPKPAPKPTQEKRKALIAGAELMQRKRSGCECWDCQELTRKESGRIRSMKQSLAEYHEASNNWFCKVCNYDDRQCVCDNCESAKTQYLPVKVLGYEDGYEDGRKGSSPRQDGDEYTVGYKDGEGDRVYS